MVFINWFSICLFYIYLFILFLKHIRQTVLTRAGSRSQVENVEEETEAAIAREMSRDRNHSGSSSSGGSVVPHPEVIDLTEHKLEEEAVSPTEQPGPYERSGRDGLPPVQLRVGGNRGSPHPSSDNIFTLFLLNHNQKRKSFHIHLIHYVIFCPSQNPHSCLEDITSSVPSPGHSPVRWCLWIHRRMALPFRAPCP